MTINLPSVLAIVFLFVVLLIHQWWLRLLFGPLVAFAILCAVAEARHWRKILLLAMCLCPSVVSADVVRVESTASQCVNGSVCSTIVNYGSGVIVGEMRDGRAAVLTAGHVTAGAQSVHIGWFGGQRLLATVVAARNDSMLDAALLAVRMPDSKWNCNPLSERVTPDVDVKLAGFPESSACTTLRGTLRGNTIQRVTVRQGMSGGPVFHEGYTVGIIRGHYTNGAQDSICTPSPVICAWLRESLGYVPSCNCEPTPKPAVKPSPIAIAPPPPRDSDGIDRIVAKLELIERRLTVIERMPIQSGERGEVGPSGERGPVGPRGEKGDRGLPGAPVDRSEITQLRAEIDSLKQLHLTVQMKANGIVVDEDRYPITGYVETIDSAGNPVRTPKPIVFEFSRRDKTVLSGAE